MTLLFSFAHPDDESFSGAGTAMKYADAGARIILATATLGERGKCGDPPFCSEQELPAVRERELRHAAGIIGVHELHLLGYRDRELADAPVADMRLKLVTLIRNARPAVVFTFDPHGFNLHPITSRSAASPATRLPLRRTLAGCRMLVLPTPSRDCSGRRPSRRGTRQNYRN